MCESNVFITVVCEKAYTEFCFEKCKEKSRGCATKPYPKKGKKE